MENMFGKELKSNDEMVETSEEFHNPANQDTQIREAVNVQDVQMIDEEEGLDEEDKEDAKEDSAPTVNSLALNPLLIDSDG